MGSYSSSFCDAYTRFAVFDVKWPGATNDILAYPMSLIYSLAMSGYFPEWSYFVLDEAYSSIGGMHLTPFSIHQLRRAAIMERIHNNYVDECSIRNTLVQDIYDAGIRTTTDTEFNSI